MNESIEHQMTEIHCFNACVLTSDGSNMQAHKDH